MTALSCIWTLILIEGKRDCEEHLDTSDPGFFDFRLLTDFAACGEGDKNDYKRQPEDGYSGLLF